MWSAPTCRRFSPVDLSAGEGAFSARRPASGPHTAEYDGDKSPCESGDKSPHSIANDSGLVCRYSTSSRYTTSASGFA